MALHLESVTGVQTPRLMHVPPEISGSLGPEFIELSAAAGLVLDEWQKLHVQLAVATRADGLWAASTYGDVDPRQNGKGGIIECLSLGFLYLLRTPLVLHSAHYFPTSLEAFRRVRALIDGCDDLRRKTRRPSVSNGKEGFELTKAAGGGRLRYLARSKNAGRGFSAPAVIFDEAFSLDANAMAALLPTLSAQANPWAGYFSSAALATSAQLHALRRLALSGNAGRLAYVEHSVDPDDYGGIGSAGWEEARRDPRVWAIANPAQGIRITVEQIQTELDTLPPRVFDRERLGVPDPAPEDAGWVIPQATWESLADPSSEWTTRPVGVADVSPGGCCSLVLAGLRADGVRHVELVDSRAGTGWVAERRAELTKRYGVQVWVRDPSGPAVELEGEWRDLTGREYTEACAGFVRAATDAAVPPSERFRWRCAADLERPLMVALGGAVRREKGDGALVWARRRSGVDISPVVALSVGWLLAAESPVDPVRSVW